MRKLSLLVVVTSSTLAAQATRVWPSGYTNQPGQSALSTPFTHSNVHSLSTARAVTTFEAGSLPFGPGSVISQIAYRRDAQDPTAYPGGFGFLQVRIGPVVDAMDPAGHAQGVFAETPKVVYSGTISLPAANAPTSGAAAFQFVIPFDAPWTYGGGDFAIDVYYDGPANAFWRRDAVHIEDGFDGSFKNRGGHGVFGTVPFAPHVWTDPGLAVPGGELVSHLDGAPPQYPFGAAIALLGTWTQTFLGQTLPITLPAEYPAGSRLHTDILDWQIRYTGDHSKLFARSVASWPIPASSSLTGFSFATQWMVLDPWNSAPLPLLMSDAIEVEIGAASTVGNVHYGYSLWTYGDQLDGYHGLERGERNYVPVTQFGGTFM